MCVAMAPPQAPIQALRRTDDRQWEAYEWIHVPAASCTGERLQARSFRETFAAAAV